MFGMGSEQNDELFLMAVDDVFGLTAVHLSVLGPIQPGDVRSGDFVEVVRGQEAVATAQVVRENITEKRALILRDLIGDLPKPGDTIRVRRS
jgi:translation elongation factor EF-Tu-like GTPase